jgi:hypothetical protein
MGRKSSESVAYLWATTLAFVFCLIQLMPMHPKGIFFIPAVLTCAFFAVTPWLPRLVLVGVAGISVYESVIKGRFEGNLGNACEAIYEKQHSRNDAKSKIFPASC